MEKKLRIVVSGERSEQRPDGEYPMLENRHAHKANTGSYAVFFLITIRSRSSAAQRGQGEGQKLTKKQRRESHDDNGRRRSERSPHGHVGHD